MGDGITPVLDIPYGRLGAAVLVPASGGSVIVYGAVLPWLSVASHAPEVVEAGEVSMDAFVRVLKSQAADIAELRRVHGLPVIWAGDFNQSVSGPIAGGSWERRRVLARVLDDLGLAAWNGEAAHAKPDICAVDLICGSRDIVPVGAGRIDPRRDGVRTSDHAGYWVDLPAC